MNFRRWRWLARGYLRRHRSTLLVVILLFFVSAAILASPVSGALTGKIASYFEDTTYIEGLVATPVTLNPLLASSDSEKDLSNLMFRGLTKTDLQGNTVGDLAESWEVNPTGQVYLFRLHRDQKFQNGDPLTSKDIEFTYSLLQNPNFHTNYSATFSNLEIEVIDDYTIVFKLKDSFSPFLSLTSLGILPKKAVERQLGRGINFSRLNLTSMGTGSFTLSSFNNDSAVFNSGGKSYIFRFYKNQDDLAIALKLGEVKAAGFSNQMNFTGWKSMQIYTSPIYQRFVGVFYNVRQAPFSDKSLRQGLSYSIDKQKIVDATGSQIAYSSIPPVSWAKSDNLKKYDFSLDQAKSAFDKAGWKGDQALIKDGKPLTITLIYQNTTQFQQIADLIKSDWERVGISTTLEPLSQVNFDKRVIQEKNYQAALLMQETAVDPDQYVLWHTTQVNGSNISGISDFKLDKSLEDARHSPVKNERIAKYLDFQRFLLDASPVSFLYYPKYEFVANSKIQNIDFSSLGLPKDRLENLPKWIINPSLL